MFQVNDAVLFNFGLSSLTGRILAISDTGVRLAVKVDGYSDFSVVVSTDGYHQPMRIGRYVWKDDNPWWKLWSRPRWELEPIQGGTDGSK